MEIAAVAVSATDLARSAAFYELLGFSFPPIEDDAMHLEAQGPVRLMMDLPAVLEELHGEPPRPGNTSGFALLADTPAEVDEAVARVAAAGHTVVHQPFDAPWGQRYATVADPDGYRLDLFCPLPGAGGTW
jgi:catechol 2,3-dioxygenase-like lactoylglutathione lyase family enzyme